MRYRESRINHEIRLYVAGNTHDIAVSCTCQGTYRTWNRNYIEAKPVLPAGEAIQLWRAWHKKQLIRV